MRPLNTGVALIAILLNVQMWLLTATLNQYLAGDHAVALPAALVSAFLFLVSLGFYLFIERVDAFVHQPTEPETTPSPTIPAVPDRQ
jgi:hypothetical protein